MSKIEKYIIEVGDELYAYASKTKNYYRNPMCGNYRTSCRVCGLKPRLNIQGTSGITSDFKIVFTDIEEINQIPESGDYYDNIVLAEFGRFLGIEGTTHDITTLKAQVVNAHQIDLNVDMKKPGATGVYEISVENTGKLDGYISDITGLEEANAEEPTDIQFQLLNFKENQKIRVGEVKKFVLVVSGVKRQLQSQIRVKT